MKLWETSNKIDTEIEQFTVGKDFVLDQKLVPFDCKASLAHAKMLQKIGILTPEELALLEQGLTEILGLHAQKKFEIGLMNPTCV